MNNTSPKKLNIKSSKLMNSLFVGNFKAAFSWKGIEFQDFREYSYGNDARYIDWSASSREQATIMRRYREEKQWNILCVLDIRESLNYGNEEKKWVYREVTQLLYWACRASWEGFWGYILDRNWEKYTSPMKSEVWLHKLLRFSDSYKNISSSLSLNFLLKNKLKRSIIFIVSDNLVIDEKSFKLAGMKHDVVFIHVSSHFENTLEWHWISRLKWFMKWFTVNLDDEKKRKEYIRKRKEKLDTFAKKIKWFGIDSIFLDEQTSIFAEFLRLMKSRERS
jgi:uncharacterized protein (DUF58 family)